MGGRRIGLAALLLLGGTAQAEPRNLPAAIDDHALDAVTAPGLVRFGSERAFRSYLERLEEIEKDRRRRARRAGAVGAAGLVFAQAEVPCADPEVCLEADAGNVVVTASKSAAPSITNNQTAGVDEGDIVKQIGEFLLVLQDGRIFSIDTRGGGLALADRINVYRDPEDDDAWYDEMLVDGDHVIVTAYSYRESGTDISVFKLDRATGKVERRGVFVMSSDDYYDATNYATRVVGNRLVVYTPFAVPELIDEPGRRPVIRRWLPDDEARRGTPRIEAADIYRPVQNTIDPVVHTISICPLGSIDTRLDCRSTAFVGPEQSVFFVSPDDVFLWLSPGWADLPSTDRSCAGRPTREEVAPSALFRVPIRGGAPGVVGVPGQPVDQFGMDSSRGEFRALTLWQPIRCDPIDDGERVDSAFVRVPLRAFGERFDAVAARQITALPSVPGFTLHNRFGGDWLVFSGRSSWGGYPPDHDEPAQTYDVVAVPVARPGRPATIALPHNVIRLERVGNDFIANGYRDAAGLDLSLLRMTPSPFAAGRVRLDRRYETEGRSHAFNSLVEDDGSGVLGVPTAASEADSGRWVWRSASSDLSFLTLAPNGTLARAGELTITRPEPSRDYSCEVSCIDWYGNTRPIFTRGRIFGLMGTEIVEARLDRGRITPLRGLDLTGAIGARASERNPD